MATDGVKIIDGDQAHDTYWGIMDLYDSGADFDKITKRFPIIQADYFDDFDNEIYVTACALALWEIGQMTGEKLEYVKSIIEKGACVKKWAENDPRDGKAREKEITKFWKKISQPNTKVRARKKYRKIVNFYFQPDELLTFQLRDGNYRAVVCSSIDQYRGKCNYAFVPTTYNSPKKPTVDDLRDKEILGLKIGSGFSQQMTLERQPGLERVWNFVGGTFNFSFGLVTHLIEHKDFVDFKDKFEKVGTLKIIDGLKEMGSFGYADFERFETIFGDLENYTAAFKYQKYPVTVLCDL